MNVIIISAYDPIPGDSIPLIRYGKIAEELCREGHSVVYITSSFFHLDKCYRPRSNWSEDSSLKNIRLLYLNTLKYSKNTGLGRISNHIQFAIQLGYALKKLSSFQPDIILSAFPPIMANYVAASFSKKHKIRFIIDIQDLWPEALLVSFKNKFFLNIVCFPSFWIRNRILNKSFGITSVAKAYLSSLDIDPEKPTGIFPLGSLIATNSADKNESTGSFIKKPGDKWIIYIGSSANNPELEMIGKVAYRLQAYTFFIVGKGLSSIKSMQKLRDHPNVNIIDNLPTQDLEGLVHSCDAGLLLINKYSQTALPNKLFTYFSAGLPVISCYINEDLDEIKHQTGGIIYYRQGNTESMMASILAACDIPEVKREAIKSFAFLNFDSRQIYLNYRIWLENIMNKQ
jgi:glycosyltransferase involved in cell wall biosynthesis